MTAYNVASAAMPSPVARKRLANSLVMLASIASGVRTSMIRYGGREPHLTRLRWAVMYALRHTAYRGWSYPAIADYFFMDHTTVMHGVRRAEAMMAIDEDYSTFVASLVQRARHG